MSPVFRRFIPALMLWTVGQPAFAFDTMTRSVCQDSVRQIMALADPDGADLSLQVHNIGVTTDMWCVIAGSDAGFEGSTFDTLEWRMEGSELWTNDALAPMALQLRLRGLDPDGMEGNATSTDRPPLSAEVTLRQEPQAGLLILESATLFNDAGDILTLSGVFERVFLTSTSMMQVSMGSAAFKAGLFSMTTGGDVDDPFGIYVDMTVSGNPDAVAQEAFAAISSLPDGIIDDASRAELTGFAAELPYPVGTLDVSASSERGLGLMQLGTTAALSFLTALEDGETAKDIGDILQVTLDGVTIEANWSPVE